MSTSEFDLHHLETFSPVVAPSLRDERKPLHRIRQVRHEQDMSLRRVAQHMHRDLDEVKHEEEADTDLPLSRLYAWQEALEVPVADLLVDSDAPLSPPVLQRARLIRLMKTAAAIQSRFGQNLPPGSCALICPKAGSNMRR